MSHEERERVANEVGLGLVGAFFALRSLDKEFAGMVLQVWDEQVAGGRSYRHDNHMVKCDSPVLPNVFRRNLPIAMLVAGGPTGLSRSAAAKGRSP